MAKTVHFKKDVVAGTVRVQRVDSFNLRMFEEDILSLFLSTVHPRRLPQAHLCVVRSCNGLSLEVRKDFPDFDRQVIMSLDWINVEAAHTIKTFFDENDLIIWGLRLLYELKCKYNDQAGLPLCKNCLWSLNSGQLSSMDIDFLEQDRQDQKRAKIMA